MLELVAAGQQYTGARGLCSALTDGMAVMTMESKRGGRSTNHWSGSGSEPTLHDEASSKAINFRFSIPSKGGGGTECMVRVPSEDFGRVVSAMVKTDPQSPYSIVQALLNAGFDNAVEAFERAKQEWMNREIRFLELRRQYATERGQRSAADGS
jgi:hypothetical protein